jgi:U3 small nucleolar RNA-associated protein 14
VYIERASSSTKYYRQKVVKLNTLAKRQRKQMMEMTATAEEMVKEIEDHKNHISELERALLIAAESEAVRMDLGTLSQYAAEGTKNREDFSF